MPRNTIKLFKRLHPIINSKLYQLLVTESRSNILIQYNILRQYIVRKTKLFSDYKLLNFLKFINKIYRFLYYEFRIDI